MSAAAKREAARRNPEPLFQNLTAAQVNAKLEDMKCGRVQNLNWTDVRVVPLTGAAPGKQRFDIVPKVAPPPEPRAGPPRLAIPEFAYVSGCRQRKMLSPYAQLYSWLRTNNWDARRKDGPNVLAWAETLAERVLAAGGVATWSAAQRRVFPASVRRFVSTVLRPSAGRNDAFAEFTRWLGTSGTLAGAGSLLPAPSTRAFSSQLCPMAQLIKVTKTLYVRVLAVSSRIKALRTLAEKCPTAQLGTPEHLKKLRGVWGMFHRQCLPLMVYARAWCEYFGLRLHGSPYGPLIWWNLWHWYVGNALRDIANRRQNDPDDARKRMQKTAIVNSQLVLEPPVLHAFIRRELARPLPRARKALASDPWKPERQRPTMPGPPPEFSRVAYLQPASWDTYFVQELPAQWHEWLGTNTVGGKGFRYRQYALAPNQKQLRTSNGADPEKAVMFRFVGECTKVRPARRALRRPPLRQVPLEMFAAADEKF